MGNDGRSHEPMVSTEPLTTQGIELKSIVVRSYRRSAVVASASSNPRLLSSTSSSAEVSASGRIFLVLKIESWTPNSIGAGGQLRELLWEGIRLSFKRRPSLGWMEACGRDVTAVLERRFWEEQAEMPGLKERPSNPSRRIQGLSSSGRL